MKIALLGVDGSGKSTTIELVKDVFPNKLIYHYHNVPIPHKLANNNVDTDLQSFGAKRLGRITSELKVLYKIAQFLILWFSKCRVIYDSKNIVIVDRVISDMFVDKRRYRLHEKTGSAKFSLMLLGFFDYVIVLDAETKVILSRSSEKSEAELNELRKKYLSLSRLRGLDIIKTDVSTAQTRRKILELLTNG